MIFQCFSNSSFFTDYGSSTVVSGYGNEYAYAEQWEYGRWNAYAYGVWAIIYSMTFYAGVDAQILFTGWHTTTWQQMLGSCVAMLVAAMLHEGIRALRQRIKEEAISRHHRYRQEHRSVSPTDDVDLINISVPRLTIKQLYWIHHTLQSVLYLVQVTLSYMLMLVAMTYNVWLFISIVLGAMLGFFIFNFKRSMSFDFEPIEDPCH